VEELVDVYIQDIQLAPNPTRGPMSLRFTITQPGRVSVKVYNTIGQLTRELVDTELTQGSHDIIWDGKDNAGRTLSSGSYIFRIDVAGSVINKAVLIVK
jgi:flagellar hook assembly protein FlgD